MSEKKKAFYRKVRVTILVFVGIFVVLFVFHVILGMVSDIDAPVSQQFGVTPPRGPVQQMSMDSYSVSMKNIATTKIVRDSTLHAPQVSIEQKYEKIADMSATSSDFDKDEEKIRNIVGEFNALIQLENKSGLEPSRSLRMTIGVLPDLFEDFVDTVSGVGHLVLLNIEKIDKTSEYLEINAKLKSLESLRDSLVQLKRRPGSIEEMISLENRIFEVERQIQEFKGALTDFSPEREFCTVRLSLRETVIVKDPGKFLRVIKASLVWALRIFGIAMVIAFFVLLSALIVVKILEKLKWIPVVIKDKIEG
jgi:hypothetical protein